MQRNTHSWLYVASGTGVAIVEGEPPCVLPLSAQELFFRQ